jgi:hypothetical protein
MTSKLELLKEHFNTEDVTQESDNFFVVEFNQYLFFTEEEMNKESLNIATELTDSAEKRIPEDLQDYFLYNEYLDDNFVPEVIGEIYEIILDEDNNEYYLYEL